MNTITSNIAKRMNDNINYGVESLSEGSLTPRWFYMMLESILEAEGITFENETAEAFFTQAVIKQMDKKAYRVVFPVMGMDSNGNYTKESNKWA